VSVLRIAYLLLAHHQPKHVGALIKQLDHGNARFYVHVDRKSDLAPFRQALRSERAILLDNRLPIHWGGWNMVRATLRLLRCAHQEGGSDYYQLLSDSCYPIKSNQEIVAKLARSNLNYMTINEQMQPGSRTYNRLFSDRDLRLIKLLKRSRTLKRLRLPHYVQRLVEHRRRQKDRLMRRRLPPGVKLYKGWQWWCLTHECVTYVLHYIVSNPEYVRFFRDTRFPDESFFQTILVNSDFVHTLSPGEAKGVISGNHYVRWSEDMGRGKPCVLKEDDFDALVASEACFARKMDEIESVALVRRLRERISDRYANYC
jgi:hypothetical protein